MSSYLFYFKIYFHCRIFYKKVINSGVIYLKFEKNDCGQKHDLAKIAVYMYEPGQNEI